jgi:hypothetical protein
VEAAGSPVQAGRKRAGIWKGTASAAPPTYSVDRIICSIFQRFNLDGKPAPSTYLQKQLEITTRLIPG